MPRRNSLPCCVLVLGLAASALSLAAAPALTVDFESDTAGTVPTAAIAVTPAAPVGATNPLPAAAGYGVIVAPYAGIPPLPSPAAGRFLRIYDYDSAKGIGAEFNFVSDDSQNATAVHFGFTFAAPALASSGLLRISVGSFDLSTSLRLNTSANRPFQLTLGNAGALKLSGRTSVSATFTPDAAHRIDLYVNDDDTTALDFTGPDGVTRPLAANAVYLFLDQVALGSAAFTTTSTAPNYLTSSSSLGRCGFSTVTSDVGIDFAVDDLRVDILTAGSGVRTIPSGLGSGVSDSDLASYDPDVLLWDRAAYADGELHVSSDARWTVNAGTPVLSIAGGAVRYDYGATAAGNSGQYQRKFSDARVVNRDSAAGGFGPTVFYAFDLNVDTAPETGASSYFLGLQSTASATALNGFVWLRAGAAPGTFRVGVSTDSSAATAVFGPDELSSGTTHRVVVQYDAGTNDSTLWIDPTSAADLPAATAAKSGDQGPAQFSGLTLRIDDPARLGRFALDDLRAAATFAGALSRMPVQRPPAEVLRNGYNFSVLSDGFDAYIAGNHQLAFLRAGGDLWLAPEGGAWIVPDNPSAVQNAAAIGPSYYKIFTLREVSAGAVSAGRYALTLQNNNATASSYQLALDTAVATHVHPGVGGNGALAPTPVTLAANAAADVTFVSATGHTLRAIGFDQLTAGSGSTAGRQFLTVNLPPRSVRQITLCFDPLSVDRPQDWQVFQRQTQAAGAVVVAGRAPEGTQTVTVEFATGDLRAPPRAGALPVGPQPVTLDPGSLLFTADFTLPAGGWYRATVRAVDAGGALLAERVIEHVGVGEVFLAAGQSNSTNSGESGSGADRLTPRTGLAVSFSGGHWQPAADPQPGNHDQTAHGSYYPAFCDGLAARLGVPVAVASTGHGGTSVAQWQKDAAYDFSSYTNAYANGLYQWTLARVQQFAPGGFRALLWHQGESDSSHGLGSVRTTEDNYYNALKRVITTMRADAGWTFPWFVAEASLWPAENTPFGDPNVALAQQRLWADGIAFVGPNTDLLGPDFRQTLSANASRVHFPPAGLAAHGGLWVEKVGAYVENVYRLTTSSAPCFIGQPDAQTGTLTANTGDRVVLIATATGHPLPAYQWQKDGAALLDATGQTLVVPAATASDAGVYRVVATNSVGTATSDGATLIITNNAAPALILSNPLNATTVTGGAAEFVALASGNPAPTWQWTRNGTLITNATSATLRLVNVTTADAGVYAATATNATGSATAAAATLTVTTGAAAILSPPASQSVNAGQNAIFGVTISTPSPAAIQWLKNGVALVGATNVTLILATTQPADAGSYGARVTNSGGSITSAAAALVVNVLAGAPVIAAQPSAQMVTNGGTVTWSVTATGTAPLAYQWKKNGAILAGATDATLTLADAQPADVGTYTVTVTNSFGAATSAPAALAVNVAVATTRLVNLSVRSRAGGGDQTLIMGFVVAGAGVQETLVRGIGPGLVPYGVPAASVLADPQVRLFDNATGDQLDQNDDWGGAPALANAFAALGAFPLAADAKDAALLVTLEPGVYSGHVTTAAGPAGLALLEVYDASLAGGAYFSNVSVRSSVGAGDDILIAGFVLAGTAPQRLLIRGVGPSLVAYGVDASTALADPTLTLYHESTAVAADDDWAGAPALQAAFGEVGAFALDGAASKDAALLVTLAPGVYTVQLAGMQDTTGVALIELYVMP